MPSSSEIQAARRFTADAPQLLRRSRAFQALNADAQQNILRDLKRIHQTLGDPYSFELGTPLDLHRRPGFPGTPQPNQSPAAPAPTAPADGNVPNPRIAATETLASRAGALSDEINFPAFVAALVHGTFNAIVDASIRQMEAFADLVSAVAKDVDQFTSQNVTPNQARDWLVKQYPQDLQVAFVDGQPSLEARAGADGETLSPPWLADFGLEGQPLNGDLIEQQLIPIARSRIGQSRLQMLATMVLLGMSRVVVRDGSISARVLIRAQAQDKAKVEYATSADPSPQTWGDRASSVYSQPTMMVSTVGVNVQTDTQLKAELFGEVRINFASETLPLERFVDPARVTLLQRNARVPQPGTTTAPAGAPSVAATPALPDVTPALAPPPNPAPAATPLPAAAAPPAGARAGSTP